jgi:8-oxo-dGTP pyrophosphatase MutT (NUDIX family)
MLPVGVLDHLRPRLLDPSRAGRPRRDAVACAVLVPLVPVGSEFEVVFTVRSPDLPSHAGQVAFPGGKFAAEVDASLADTALRETHEEIGLTRPDVEIIGALDEVRTLSGDFVITPFVGVIRPAASIRPNPAEVSAVFMATRAELDDPARRATEIREWRGQRFEVPLIRTGSHTIWGATHRITMDLLERLADPSRPR